MYIDMYMECTCFSVCCMASARRCQNGMQSGI